MKGSVYLYFDHTQLTYGSFKDRRGQQASLLRKDKRLTFYDLDADDLDRPTHLCANGVLYRGEDGAWHANVDQSSFHSALHL